MNFNAKARRRWLGALFLLAAILMLVTGETSPGKRLEGVAFIVYWLACFGFAALAMLVAILDARALRRDIRAEQQALLQDALKEIKRGKASSASFKPPKDAQPSQSNSPYPG